MISKTSINDLVTHVLNIKYACTNAY